MPARSGGSYLRAELRCCVLYRFFCYKQLNITFATHLGTPTRVRDTLAEALLAQGLISQNAYQAYLQQVCAAFPTADSLGRYDPMSVEELYTFVHGIRKQLLGAEALDTASILRARQPLEFDPSSGIDQRAKKDALLKQTDCVLLALFDTSLFSLLAEDLERIPHNNIWLLVSKEPGDDLPTQAVLSRLLKGRKAIRYLQAEEGCLTLPSENACLLAYGEDALLHCRGLQLDSIISAVPTGYHAQALVNQLGMARPCVVYVPKGLDITGYVPITDHSRLTYWQLFLLWRDHGDSIYRLSERQLYEAYPQYFLNIYENSPDSPETKPDFPIRLPARIPLEQAREQAIRSYFDSFPKVSYHRTCQDGILVDAVKLPGAKNAQVLSCNGGLRRSLAQAPDGLVSNFLFFLTDKLGNLYNDLRADRPYEQADAAAGHLDYMLSREMNKETFPLFSKACIAKNRDGSFVFFPFRLGDGSVQVNGVCLKWSADMVDTEVPGPIRVYTPYYSLADEAADRQTYRKVVGYGRLNLVVLQDRICCIRKGDVLLPSVGVVISLTPEHPLIHSLTPLEDGYYSTEGVSLTVALAPPAGFTKQQWEQVSWAYGGGMTLIRDGIGICDDDQTEARFRQEGWLSPLSRQTQESALHTMVKQPRTALGLTADGALVVLVYSGRTRRSVGADYREMVQIARQLFPDIRQLMNVDGGASAVLGLVTRGSFMELSFPSPSAGSCAGMARPVNTVLHIPIE